MRRAARHRAFGRDERGSVTIEYVVTLPLFLAALAFAFEFGQIFVAHHSTVNNVRSAARYLSRSDLSAADITIATNIVRTGRTTGGVTPDYLQPANATIVVNDTYSTFAPPDFSRAGKTFQIRATVTFPLTIFGFVDNSGRTGIPFVIVEDMRHVGV